MVDIEYKTGRDTRSQVGEILSANGVTPVQEWVYLQCSDIEKVEGWVLYISVTSTQIIAFLQSKIEVLLSLEADIKFPVNETITAMLCDGSLGVENIGKVISITPRGSSSLPKIYSAILPLTKGYRGPAVRESLHLGSILYAQYNGTEINETIKPSWPFGKIEGKKVTTKHEFKNGSIVVEKELKSTPKGRVFTATWKTLFSKKTCLIKEGYHDVHVDSHGRDENSRLQWQYTLHKRLENAIPLPKALLLFEDEGNSYLVMEFIEGGSLSKVITDLCGDHSWNTLPQTNKRTVMFYLLQVITIIESLHNNGFVHRDINLTNFMVTPSGKVVAIDLELAYELKGSAKPFKLGSEGHMSPEQKRTETPDVPEDIYALGALMIACFANVPPPNLGNIDYDRISDQLRFFINNDEFVNLIVRCISPVAADRPQIGEIKQILKDSQYRDSMPTDIDAQQVKERVKWMIQESINVLSSPLMTDSSGRWHNHTKVERTLERSNIELESPSASFLKGVSGIFYVLAEAKRAGFDLPNNQVLDANFNVLLNAAVNNGTEDKGLYNGDTGLVIGISSALELGLDGLKENPSQFLKKLLSESAAESNLIDGLAGIGLVSMLCRALDPTTAQGLSSSVAKALIEKQLPDGSWISDQAGVSKKTGLDEGVAGITYFLLLHYEKYETETSKTACKKALEWLLKQGNRGNGTYMWAIDSSSGHVSPWLANGFVGIAVCLLKAYEIFEDESYLQISDSILRNFETKLISTNLLLLNGILGLGIVYTEAYRVSRNAEWIERSLWLEECIHSTYVKYKTLGIYWITKESTNLCPVPNLSHGNVGVILYLLLLYEQLPKSNPNHYEN